MTETKGEFTNTYSLKVGDCKEKKDTPSSYYLYPGTALYYEIKIKHNETEKEWIILRRFSEVRKFYEQIRPTCAAVGVNFEGFPQHSAVLSGGGYTGNLYETNPKSDFAAERIKILTSVLTDFNSKTDATGGSLLDLKAARSFFEIDKHLATETNLTLPKAIGDASTGAQHNREETLPPQPEPNTTFREDDWLSTLTRSTPATFFVVFVVVLAALYAFAAEQHH